MFLYRRAGSGGSFVVNILLVIGAVGLAGMIAVTAYYTSHKGVEKQTGASSRLAQTLWGNSAPLYDVGSNNGVGVVQPRNPSFQGVTWNTSVWPPLLTIEGTNFGRNPNGPQANLQVRNNTRQWSAANVGTEVVASVSSWSNTKIQVGEFRGYGGDRIFAPNDSVTILVKNPQTGQEVSYETPYPADAPMPQLLFDPVPATMIAQKSTTLSGVVRFNGQAMGGQQVFLTGTGNFSGGGGAQVGSRYRVLTDANGRWSATYTVPATPGDVRLTANCNGSSVSQTVRVIPDFAVTLTAEANQTDNQVKLTATVNQPLAGFRLSIVNQTTGQTIASTTQGQTLTATITAVEHQTHTFVAIIE